MRALLHPHYAGFTESVRLHNRLPGYPGSRGYSRMDPESKRLPGRDPGGVPVIRHETYLWGWSSWAWIFPFFSVVSGRLSTVDPSGAVIRNMT